MRRLVNKFCHHGTKNARQSPMCSSGAHLTSQPHYVPIAFSMWNGMGLACETIISTSTPHSSFIHTPPPPHTLLLHPHPSTSSHSFTHTPPPPHTQLRQLVASVFRVWWTFVMTCSWRMPSTRLWPGLVALTSLSTTPVPYTSPIPQTPQ